MSEENVELMRRAYEAWNQGDLDRVAGLLDDHVVLRTAEGWPEQVVYGKENVRSFYEGYAESVGNVSVIEDLVDAGDSILVRVTARMSGEVSGLTGDLKFSHVMTFRHGKIVLIEYYWDHAEAREAVGRG